MKSLVNRILSVGMALAAVAAVHAQDKSIKADVPFSFYVGSTVMPQGAYRMTDLSSRNVMWIKSMDNDAAKAIATMTVVGKSESEAPRLVFNRYGNVYFLHQIWTGNSSTGQSLGSSKREKELASSGIAPTLAVIRLAVH